MSGDLKKKSWKRILEWERFDELEKQKGGCSGWGIVSMVGAVLVCSGYCNKICTMGDLNGRNVFSQSFGGGRSEMRELV